MKKEYTLAQQFALIGLDGLSCIHRSAAKYAAVRGIAAAKLLEELLSENEEVQAEEFQKKLETGIVSVNGMKKKELDAVESEMQRLLLADGTMEAAPDLLGCDMNYYTAGVSMKSYRSDREVYLSIVESMRAEILEEGPITVECACLLWLIRESGCMHDIFSVREQERVQERMMDFGTNCESSSEDYISVIWRQELHRGGEQMIKSFLKGKRELFKNPYLEGVNLLFPFLDRRQAIFVDFVIFGTTVKDRRRAMIDFLSKRGHLVEEVKNGTETLLRIDNAYYRIWPKTVSSGRIPIQGANLQPVYR